MYDRSLLTVDIAGAQPKSRNAYMNRLLPNQLSYDEQSRLQYNNNKFQSRIINLAEGDINMIFIILLTFVFPRGKNISSDPKRSIMRSQKMKQNNLEPQKIISINQSIIPQLQGQIDSDRLLCTNDIDGALPGSLQSRAVRNQEIAQKIRFQRDEQRKQQNRALYNSHIDQTFDQQNEETPPKRNQSYSLQTSPAPNQIEHPKYEYMNKPQKLPPITERVSASINPISNKLQLRQNNRNYLLEDYEKTLSLLQKQPPLRLFV